MVMPPGIKTRINDAIKKALLIKNKDMPNVYSFTSGKRSSSFVRSSGKPGSKAIQWIIPIAYHLSQQATVRRERQEILDMCTEIIKDTEDSAVGTIHVNVDYSIIIDSSDTVMGTSAIIQSDVDGTRRIHNAEAAQVQETIPTTLPMQLAQPARTESPLDWCWHDENAADAHKNTLRVTQEMETLVKEKIKHYGNGFVTQSSRRVISEEGHVLQVVIHDNNAVTTTEQMQQKRAPLTENIRTIFNDKKKQASEVIKAEIKYVSGKENNAPPHEKKEGGGELSTELDAIFGFSEGNMESMIADDELQQLISDE